MGFLVALGGLALLFVAGVFVVSHIIARRMNEADEEMSLHPLISHELGHAHQLKAGEPVNHKDYK